MAVITVGSGKDYATIQDALDNANADDIIDVYEGTYNEDIDLTQNGLTVQKHPGEAVVWNLNGSGEGIDFASKTGITIKDFDDTNVTANKTQKYCIVGMGDDFLLSNLNIEIGTYAMYTCMALMGTNHLAISASGEVEDILFTGTGSFWSAGHGHIRSIPANTYTHTIQKVFSHHSEESSFTQNSAGGTINWYNCIADDPDEFGFHLAGASTHITNYYNCVVYKANISFDFIESNKVINIKNCISHSPTDMHFNWTDSGTLTSDYNVCYGAGGSFAEIGNVDKTFAEWKAATGGDANSYDTDPGLTDPANDDFTLDGSGSADDAGEDLSGTFTDDYAGTTRTTPWDIGAYDYVSFIEHEKALSDSLSISELLANKATLKISDSEGIAEAKVKEPGKGISDSQTILESLAKSFTKPVSDSQALSEALAKGASLTMAETLAISEILANSSTLSVSDSQAILEDLILALGLYRTVSDAVSFSESLALAEAKVLSDTVSLAEGMILGIGAGLADLVSISEALAFSSTKPLTESVPISESVANQTTIGVGDSISLSEALAKGSVVGLGDSISFAESVEAGLVTDLELDLDDIFTMTDIITSAYFIVRTGDTAFIRSDIP